MVSLGLSKASVNPVQYDIEDFNFAPKSSQNNICYAQVLGVKLVVQMDSIWSLRIALNSELIIRKTYLLQKNFVFWIIMIKAKVSKRLTSCKTDIVDYLKESKEFALEHALVNYYKNIKGFYFRLSGAFEPMSWR